MSDREPRTSGEPHDPTISQLLAHLTEMRRAVPVNYKLKEELRKRLLEQMRQQQMTDAQAPETAGGPAARPRGWRIAAGVVAVAMAATVLLWPGERIALGEQQALPLPVSDEVERVALSPKGERVAFLEADGRLHLYGASEDAAHDQLTMPATKGTYDAVAWGGSRLAVTEHDADRSRLWIVNAKEKETSPASRLLCEETDGRIDHLSWSFGGTQIAYSRVSGSRSEVWIVNTVTFSAKKLTDGSHPEWSPDGRTIAYDKDGSVWLIDPKTGQTREVAAGTRPSWQGDDQLTYTGPDGKLMEAWINGADPAKTAAVGGLHRDTIRRAVWSQNGKWLLIAKQTEQGTTYWLASRD